MKDTRQVAGLGFVPCAKKSLFSGSLERSFPGKAPICYTLSDVLLSSYAEK